MARQNKRDWFQDRDGVWSIYKHPDDTDKYDFSFNFGKLNCVDVMIDTVEVIDVKQISVSNVLVQNNLVNITVDGAGYPGECTLKLTLDDGRVKHTVRRFLNRDR